MERPLTPLNLGPADERVAGMSRYELVAAVVLQGQMASVGADESAALQLRMVQRSFTIADVFFEELQRRLEVFNKHMQQSETVIRPVLCRCGSKMVYGNGQYSCGTCMSVWTPCQDGLVLAPVRS